MPRISVIIPCYFNEQNIPLSTKELIENEKQFDKNVDFEYVMVDDGSKDNTLNELLLFKETFPEKVKVVKLSGNFGSYNAIIAGMKYATGDCTVVIAADMQDPPELIFKMYEYWEKGIKLVLANREKRDDLFLDRLFATWYHKLIKKYALPAMPKGGFDFCLFDRKLREELVEMDEKNTNTLFLLVWLKYDFVSIPYLRKKREVGKSKWTVRKKIKLLIDSFVSFSFMPIRFISVSALFLGMVSIVYAIYIIYAKMTGKIQLEGWTTMMLVFLLVSSFQMIAIGILGEYIWRTLDAVKNRPNYVVEKIYD